MSKKDEVKSMILNLEESTPVSAEMSCSDENKVELDVLYTVNNHLYFYKEINPESAALFNKTLSEMYSDLISAMLSSGLSNPIIEIHLNSPGGEASACFAMVSKLKDIKRGYGIIPIPMKVITHVEGESCSAASILSVVGSERTMSEYSVMLIHEVLGGFMGKKEDLKNYAQNLDLLSGNMKNIYLENSKLTMEEVEELVKDDLLFDAKTCLKFGLIDRII